MIDLKNTAIKVGIHEIFSGEYTTSDDGFGFVKTLHGDISKVRVLGTVVEKYASNDRNYAFVTIDDSTDTINVKTFKDDTKKLINISAGSIIDVIGRIREYEGELYIQPDSVVKVDVNFELLRKIELILEKEEIPKKNIEILLLKKISELDSGDGARLSTLVSNIRGCDENELLGVLRNLMMRGEIFEPKKGLFKRVE